MAGRTDIRCRTATHGESPGHGAGRKRRRSTSSSPLPVTYPWSTAHREVTKRVEELIGLECEQFTRAVVMPQGRFDELLRSTESERNEILKSILGLSDIDQTRLVATAYRDELRDTYTRYTERRANLPADPARMLSDAKQSLMEATAQRKLLASAIEAVEEPRQIAERINLTLGPLESALAAVPAVEGDSIEILRLSLKRGTQLREELDRASEDKTKTKEEIASIDNRASRSAGWIRVARCADGCDISSRRCGRSVPRRPRTTGAGAEQAWPASGSSPREGGAVEARDCAR